MIELQCPLIIAALFAVVAVPPALEVSASPPKRPDIFQAQPLLSYCAFARRKFCFIHIGFFGRRIFLGSVVECMLYTQVVSTVLFLACPGPA
ncbi:MAG: hypothetical protein ACREDL_24380, partial [Bradyrhizobium sp.]